ncbi:MAG: LAGLIDADG family homing endonuclease, partial [Chloroflexota bacterium]
VATDIMVSKYFRKAGVPQFDAEGNPILDADGEPVLGPERSAKQVFDRLVDTWRHWGEQYNYFASEEDAETFSAELKYMLATQMAAPNSPQWFNTGLHHAYGITGPSQGHFYLEPMTGELRMSEDAYSRPTPHACFIQSVDDDLVGEGGIFDLLTREARVFKYGSGTGSNFSRIRAEGEPLSGGGTSSGLMSFLKVFDRAAGAIKSGGTTRRAAKMVVVDADHPDIEAFITWKADEERKVQALIDAGYSADFNGEAYQTVSGQNANNSVRVTSEFIDAVKNDGDWDLTRRTDGSVARTVKARDLWDKIANAAWASADPGMQYDTTINEWHTSPQSGRINGSNPCVTGDTLVATTEGYRRIENLVGQVVEVVAGDGEASLVTRVFPTGIKSVYQLRTQSGYSLRLTGDHRVQTQRGDVPAGELRAGDRLQLQGAGFGSRTLGTGVAEYLGAAVGDGCMTGTQGHVFVTVGKNERALADKFAETLNNFGDPDGDGRARRQKNVYETATSLRVGTSAAPLRALAERYTVIDQGSIEKRFSDEVFNLDQSTQAALLRGLFTADGTVADYGEKSQYISLDSVSLALLEQAQLMLLSFGIKGKIYRNRSKAVVQEMPGGEYERQPMHSLRISRSSRLRFAELIGFVPQSDKAERLIALNQRVKTYSDRFDDEFVELEYIGEEPVYDLTEPRTSHFVANGMVVHNCSEYMFLDDTACNLASLNLMKFYDAESRHFDAESLKHASRLWTVVLEISVLMAQFPSAEIARKSYIFRTLGLGYANLGALLMTMGLPYDSDEGRAIAGAITGLLTGESYATSAEMAREFGAFPGYAENRDDMLRVIRNHRRAAYNTPDDEYEELSVAPMGIDSDHCPSGLLDSVRDSWDRALEWGEEWGYRNAQTTLLAPTGTIGLLMDCDTTGVEPDFALVKFKKLSGGGYFKIANQSIAPALHALGYRENQINDIIRYVLGTLTLDGAPHVNRNSLKERGLTDADVDKINESLASVFELPFAFNVWTLGEEAMRRLGLTEEQWSRPDFDLLRAIGFSRKQIEEANEVICGMQTIEGAPHIKDEHLAVFDCANRCGKTGQRFIHYMGHIKMMAATQPFLSGAISKTINMPSEATIEDIEHAYMQGWELALKALALYRDGSKLSQPLSAKSDAKHDEDEEEEEATPEPVAAAAGPITTNREGFRPVRRPMPARRRGYTQEARVAGHKLYLRTGEYEDGTLGEIFIDLHKEGATMRSLVNCFAIAVSKGLQYGVPLQEFVDTFTYTRFEPQGMVDGHPNIKMATSVIDYVFRALGYDYLGRTDLVQLPDDDHEGIAPEHPPVIEAAATGGLETGRPVNGERGNGGNGSHDYEGEMEVVAVARFEPAGEPAAQAAAPSPQGDGGMSAQLSGMMGDAPMCDVCGHITVRNGSCYKCLNCGNSLGCS